MTEAISVLNEWPTVVFCAPHKKILIFTMRGITMVAQHNTGRSSNPFFLPPVPLVACACGGILALAVLHPRSLCRRPRVVLISGLKRECGIGPMTLAQGTRASRSRGASWLRVDVNMRVITWWMLLAGVSRILHALGNRATMSTAARRWHIA